MITLVSATNVWAVGSYGNSSGSTNTLIEHWNSSSLNIVSNPHPPVRLSSVAAVSATDIWAVGSSSNSNSRVQTLIEHWNGSS
ncbi:MAG TPA: hypothetical protein VFA41_23850 [Ktedonobacteraceae bacterium]|nr:hypothetical protein [Ktedonobacteraceae bacterium]